VNTSDKEDSALPEELAHIDFSSICKNCSINCCRRFYAVLLPEEAARLSKVVEVFKVSTKYGDVYAVGARDGKPCPALTADGRCSIYKIRPVDCRMWPVMVYIDEKTGEKVAYLDLECLAAAEGRIGEDFINRVLEGYKKLRIDTEWLKRYTAAPWPNRLKEVSRWR